MLRLRQTLRGIPFFIEVIDDKHVFERMENIIWEDETNFVTTMHYYYLNGELVKTIRVEEDQYVCDLIVQSDNSFLLQVEMP